MHLSISARITLKDTPKEYRGIKSTNITSGGNIKVSLSKMVIMVIREVLDWYCIIDDADTLNAEVELIKQWLDGVKIQEHKQPEIAQSQGKLF